MIYLARHGQTTYNLEGRFQGWGGVPLDATGRQQALELAEAVAAVEPVTLVSSDLARAAETAAIVAAVVGLEVQSDRRFAETETGDWTDRSFADIIEQDPDGFAAFLRLDRDWGFPGGESIAGHLARVQAGLADWQARADRHPVVIICHGNVIRLALREAGRGDEPRPENGSFVAL